MSPPPPAHVQSTQVMPHMPQVMPHTPQVMPHTSRSGSTAETNEDR